MTMLTRKSPELLQLRKIKESQPQVRIDTGRLTFSRGASELCGMEEGLFLEFEQLGRNWIFIVTPNPDGFPIFRRDDLMGKMIHSRTLVRLIKDSTPYRFPATFKIQKCEGRAEYYGHEMFEILMDCPVNLKED